ncbi:MAG: hypothetical protein D6796_10370 [Caldilineae bacterium]|nr:MAG: hypothetical protein D6796_10370 [Caldilineae bacterium]
MSEAVYNLRKGDCAHLSIFQIPSQMTLLNGVIIRIFSTFATLRQLRVRFKFLTDILPDQP